MTQQERDELRGLFYLERGSLTRLERELSISRPQLNRWFRFGRVPAVATPSSFEKLIRKRGAEIRRARCGGMTQEERDELRGLFWLERGSLTRLERELSISRTQLNKWFRFGRIPAVDNFENLVRARAAELQQEFVSRSRSTR